MSSDQANMDNIIRDKLKHLEVSPPTHVWAGVQQGIADQRTPLFWLSSAKYWLIGTAAVVLIAIGLWWLLSVDNSKENTNANQVNNIETPDSILPSSSEQQDLDSERTVTDKIFESEETVVQELPDQNQFNSINAGTEPAIQEEIIPINTLSSESTVLASNDKTSTSTIAILQDQNNLSQTQVETRSADHVNLSLTDQSAARKSIEYSLKQAQINAAIAATSANDVGLAAFQPYWNLGLYFTPEAMLTNVDSVNLMPTYSFAFEPSWYFNKHWFMRFGLGMAYIRDAGFAKVDYTSQDYVGSYDSVISVTFETIGEETYPVYHTKEVDIWDSIRHVANSDITNTYYKLQVPLLFGYHHSTSKLKWYFYAGPAFNYTIYEDIEDPSATIDFIEIHQLENNLPQRTTFDMQLWIGAGIDLRLGSKFSMAFEPNYRYYFKPVYQESNYETALSGLGLRVGLIYKLSGK